MSFQDSFTTLQNRTYQVFASPEEPVDASYRLIFQLDDSSGPFLVELRLTHPGAVLLGLNPEAATDWLWNEGLSLIRNAANAQELVPGTYIIDVQRAQRIKEIRLRQLLQNS